MSALEKITALGSDLESGVVEDPLRVDNPTSTSSQTETSVRDMTLKNCPLVSNFLLNPSSAKKGRTDSESVVRSALIANEHLR